MKTKLKINFKTDTLTTNEKSMFPIGCIISFGGNVNIPTGFLLCNGESVERAVYKDLFEIIGTTYGAEDDDHFNLPNLNGKFVEGGENAGIEKEAGLPNITGSATGAVSEGVATSASDSALTIYRANTTGRAAGSGAGQCTISINASRCSSVYGNSTTVQPPALTMKYIIKY